MAEDEKAAVENQVYKNGIAQENYDFELTQDQKLAIQAIRNWYRHYRSSPVKKRYFVLAGSAGTGKSSIIQHIIKNLGLPEEKVLCCAFTGKASLNLQRKGNYSATLHSSIYDCSKDKSGELVFSLKDYLGYKLIIIDEASMLSEDILDDVLSFDIPVIFIGDHCQLPPVKDDFNIMKKPDFTLTTILRQAAESPIIRASQMAIKGESIPFCEFPHFRKIHEQDLEDSDFLWANQVVVGTNNTRKALNQVIREIRNYRTCSPMNGERMIVLKNNSRKHIMNGQIVYLTSDPIYSNSTKSYNADWKDELEFIDPLIAATSQKKTFDFKLKDPYTEPANADLFKYAYLDFGYAISCHKAQGSGWERVIVFDEGFGFNREMKRRWLYTAITRAKKDILIVSK